MDLTSVILDTNIFVAAGFRPGSDAGRILELVRSEKLSMIWHEQTLEEIRHIINKIPPLARSWSGTAPLFSPERSYPWPLSIEDFHHIPDPADRKFAALAAATGGTLISLDADLLTTRHLAFPLILRPHEFWQRWGQEDQDRGEA
ncbi:MAG: PIN domain-containing protein [Synechococcaceae cyanobacterium SM2_3_1]|nr:PIN domain-containing protein [Synechococcaceae cyanobacterium SM2_3_1]